MTCEQIQDLILTDYADDRLTGEQKIKLDTHLAACVHCREFARAVNEKILQPFSQAERLTPSDSVWNKIRAEIDKEEPAGSFKSFIRLIGSLQPLQRSVLLYSVVMALLTLAVLRGYRSDNIRMAKPASMTTLAQNKINSDDFPVEVYGEDYLAYMVDEFSGNYASSNDGYGTAIEEYFL